jgi:hypothetical protein
VLGLFAKPTQGLKVGDWRLLECWLQVAELRFDSQTPGAVCRHGSARQADFVWGKLWPRVSGQTWNFQSKRNQALATGTDV